MLHVFCLGVLCAPNKLVVHSSRGCWRTHWVAAARLCWWSIAGGGEQQHFYCLLLNAQSGQRPAACHADCVQNLTIACSNAGTAPLSVAAAHSPAAENVGETKCSLDFATRARKVELGPAVRVPEWSSGGLCSSPSSSGRDSPVTSSSGKASQVSSGGATGGSSSSTGGPGSAASSPRVGGRYSGGSSNELRQSITRRAAATSHKEEK